MGQTVPFDTPNWILSGIDVKTGIATMNRELVLDTPGERSLVCYWKRRSGDTSICPTKLSRDFSLDGWPSDSDRR